MGLVGRLRARGRQVAEAAMQQPAIRRRVERLNQLTEDLRTETQTRVEAWLKEMEAKAWAYIQQKQEELGKAQRQMDRAQKRHEYYQLLGLPDGAPLDEVKKAYRRKMREHHPDRFAHDPDAEANAHDQAQRINSAYAELTALLTGRESRVG
ncbi:MAG: J domain-containing protein [Bradymonadia bacterium]